MLILGGSSGPGPLQELSGPHRRARDAAASRLRSTGQPSAFSGSRALPWHPGAAFHVQQLLAQQREQDAPPPARQLMLAADHAHLAERIRYFGPLTPVDLHV